MVVAICCRIRISVNLAFRGSMIAMFITKYALMTQHIFVATLGAFDKIWEMPTSFRALRELH
jgi:hypothetical protein